MKITIVSLLVVIETTLLTVAAYACDPPVLFSKPLVKADHFGTKIEATHRCYDPLSCPICSPKIRIGNGDGILPHHMSQRPTPPVFVPTKDPTCPCRRNFGL